jgi:hypothetical protein
MISLSIRYHLIGLQEVTWGEKKENKEEEDNKSHLHTTTNSSIQRYNSKQSTLSDFTT